MNRRIDNILYLDLTSLFILIYIIVVEEINIKEFIKINTLILVIYTLHTHKFYYLIIFWILFIPEFLFLVAFFYKKSISKNRYEIIKIDRVDTSNMNFITIWLKICEINAFNRLYAILSRKKANFGLIFIIWFFRIPLKMWKLLNLTLSLLYDRKWNFIEIMYQMDFIEINGRKIEIFKNKVYLNCFTLPRLMRGIGYTEYNIKHLKNNCFSNLIDLQKASRVFSAYEENNKELVQMSLLLPYNSKTAPHYTFFEKGNTIHGTSKIPIKLELNQNVEPAMRSLIKEGSTNPGTIITRENKSNKLIDKHKWVTRFELNTVKFQYLELFDLTKEEMDYIRAKDEFILNILQNNSHKQINHNMNVIKELRMGCYDYSLNCKNADIVLAIEDFEKG